MGVVCERLMVNRFGPAELASSGAGVSALPLPGSCKFPKLPLPDHIPMFESAVVSEIPLGRLEALFAFATLMSKL
jgi:hypothetical protein